MNSKNYIFLIELWTDGQTVIYGVASIYTDNIIDLTLNKFQTILNGLKNALTKIFIPTIVLKLTMNTINLVRTKRLK